MKLFDNDEAPPIAPEAGTPRFHLLRFDEIKRKETSSYLIKGVIPRTGLIIVWGPPKCGKSFLTFDAMLHVALGWDYRDRHVTAGRVVYLALEGQDGFGDRAEAFRLQHGQGDVPGFYLVKERTDLIRDHAELIRCIEAQCDGVPSAVVIDTMNRSLVGSESKDEDMAAYIRAADTIRERFGCAVIIIHHCGVDGSRPRGHTSLTGAADVQISVVRDADDNIIATVEFAKDMPQGAVIGSKLLVVELGEDQDGDQITSCVVVPVQITAVPERGGKTTKALKAFRDAFGEALDTHGKIIQVHGDGPKVRAVDLQRVRDEFCRRYANGEPDLQKRRNTTNTAFRRTINNLPPQFATEARDDHELIWLVTPERKQS
jgi:hypothetical protein